MEHPFRGLWAPIFLAAPFLIGFGIGLSFGSARFAVLALLWVPCALSLWLRLPPLASAAGVLALSGALTAGRMPFLDPGDVEPFLDRPVLLSGIVEEVRATETGWNAVAHDAVLAAPDRPGRIRVPRIFLTVRSPESSVRFPAEVRAIGRIRPIRSAGNPREVPREWFALARRVQYRFLTDASKTVFLPRDPEGIAGRFLAARARIGRWLEESAGDTRGAVFLRAVTTGETPPPSHPLVRLLRRTGLSHLLAISGLHAGIFFGASALLLRASIWCFRRRHGDPDLNRVCLFGALPACWGYILMAGAPVSGVRAAGMITVAVFCWRFLGIRSAGSAWTALFLGTILLSPWQAVSPSFLLSYTAAFFLIACAERKPPGTGPDSIPVRAVHALRGGLIGATVAFAGTLPISAVLFEGFPAGAILWNLLFAGALGAAGVGGALLSAAAGLFGIDGAGPLAGLLSVVLDAMLALLARLSGDGSGYFPLPPSGVVAPFVAVAGAAWGTAALARHGRTAWPAPVAAAALFLAWVHLPYAALPDPEMAVTALNVGRGASHRVSFPGGGCMLVDCGSRLRGDAGSRIVVPFLRGLGIRTVDVLVLTHPHEDHTGGAVAVLEALRVGEIWIPEGSSPTDFGEAIARQAAKIRTVRAGEVRRFGDAEVRVRAPRAGRGSRRTNERSLVLEIRYGHLSVWLPGDVEEGPGVWGTIFPPGPETRVLFLPHHGSPGARPAAWLSAASPAAAVSQNSDCAAWVNLLPSCRFFALENGAVTVRSDGGSVSIDQEGGARWWSRFLRLSKLPGGAPCPGDPARYPEWRSNGS